MDNYNPAPIEKKWQDFFETNKIFKTKKDKKKKILLFRNVSIPFWQYSYGSRKKLYARRCDC